jgi:hypothetical protein
LNTTLYQLLSELNREAGRVKHDYKDLFNPDLHVVPIPFFGDVLNAKVITVGLNPSDGEFRDKRWPQTNEVDEIYERLVHYFNNTQIQRHKWFVVWEKALAEIGLSYANGTAAHVDLCPWPTRPMSELPDQNRFASLVNQSMSWFWRCLEIPKSIQLILMAGAVTKKDYLNESLIKARSIDGHMLIGKASRSGKAFVNYHQFHLADKEIPAFFCSVSPSARTSRMLPLRVREHRNWLLNHLK